MEAKRNHLVNISTKNAAFKGKNDSEIYVIVQRDICLNYHLEIKKPSNWSQKRKNKIGNSTTVD